VPLRPKPPEPDEIVWLWNTCYEREPDGTWVGWAQPLGSDPDDSSERIFEVRGMTPMDAKILLADRMERFHFEAAMSDRIDDWRALQRRYARPMCYRDVPPVQWPPLGDRWRLLDFPAPVDGV
jgi:hypothetical protein